MYFCFSLYYLMNLVIDIGNSKIKTAVFKNGLLLEKNSSSTEDIIFLLQSISKKYNITNAILSRVGVLDKKELNKIKKLIDVHILNQDTNLPFINKYTTPHSLGVDRIALVGAAIDQYPNKNVLIIDAGSCITYDFVNKKREYYGGAISPGIEMRYKSLNSFTANLPKLTLINEVPFFGNSTENAIHRGVLNGVIQEIEGVIDQYKAKNKKLTIVLTGGDTIFLAKNIKSTIFANPNFLLEGLNSILIHNIDE